MRIPVIFATGDGLRAIDPTGEADVALAHSARSLREFATALDAFEEVAPRLAQAMVRQTEAVTAATATADSRGHFILPEDFSHEVRYWREAQVTQAKSAVMALNQVRDGLTDFDRLTHLAAAKSALSEFDITFPDLVGLRDAVAHANHRSRWRVNRAFQPAIPTSEGSIMYSDLASSIGYCDGDKLFLRISKNKVGTTGEISISDATLTAATLVLQRLVHGLTWDRQHVAARHLYEPFMDLKQ